MSRFNDTARAERRRKEKRDAAVVVISTVVGIGAAYFLKVLLAGLAGLVGLIALGSLIANLECMVGVRKTRKRALRWAVVIMGVGLEVAVLYPLWKEEKAVANTGEVSIPHPTKYPPKIFEIGDSGTIINWVGKPEEGPLTFVWDSGLHIDNSENGIEVSTPIRDRDGHMVAEITKNHWRTNPECWDKNYNDHALEVLDKRGHVVFQLIFLENRVQVQGEWRDEFGNGVRMSSNGKNSGARFDIWHNPEGERINEKSIKPIFVYPSKEHWGELVN